jgi:Helix-turn-helix domain
MTFSPEQAASVAGISVASIMRYIRSKRLKAHRIKGYAIKSADLCDFLTSRLVAGNAKP